MKKLILLFMSIINLSICNAFNATPVKHNNALITFINSRSVNNLTVKLYYIWLPAGEWAQFSSFANAKTTLQMTGKLKVYSIEEIEKLNKLVIEKVGKIIFQELITPILCKAKSSNFLTEIRYKITTKINIKAKRKTLFIIPQQKYLLIKCGAIINGQFIENFAVSYPLHELRLFTITKPMAMQAGTIVEQEK